MQVDIKKLKPLGVILILGFSILALIVCFTADMGIPKKYESLHDTEYYAQNSDTMNELLHEIEANVFPALPDIEEAYLNDSGTQIIIVADSESYDKVAAVISRDFDASLFSFVKIDE